MAASFFELQATAHRRTHVLVLMYLLAVVAVVFAVDALISAAYFAMRFDEFREARLAARQAGGWLNLLPHGLLAAGALVTAGAILVVSLWNIAKLAGDGAAVARMAGAREVAPGSADRLERRLLNVVEEMAIASGVRVPKVFVMDQETGINAFAAGWDVSNAVVAVTRGTLETLNRDELQGVIGHEFSHILNGDMRLNIRMIGVLAGIVFLSALGGFIMRSAGQSRGGKDSGAFALFVFGLVLFIIGYIGLFFARLIKSAVSREREFLADASSVQFTRNPDGLAGALDQIRTSAVGAMIANRYAEEMAHMYFGQAISVWLGGLFDTHPPLDERISRIRPGFAPTRYRNSRAKAEGADAEPRPPERREAAAAVLASVPAAAAGLAGGTGRRSGDQTVAWGRSAGESSALVGKVEAAHVDYAARLLAALPDGLRERLRNADGARAALVALLLAPKEEVMQAQLAALGSAGLDSLGAAARELAPALNRLGAGFHLAVIDLALPALKSAAEPQKRELSAALETVIHADRRVSLHEFVVLNLVRAQLAAPARPHAPQFASLDAVRDPALLLVSLLARAGARSAPAGSADRAANDAFRAALREMGLGEGAPLAAGALTLAAVGRALDALRELAPLAKARLIKGLFAAATADGTIRVVEAELLRLAGAVLDCPLPPLLAEIDPATLAD
jgi:Zn-dependent protease with chaperone function